MKKCFVYCCGDGGEWSIDKIPGNNGENTTNKPNDTEKTVQ